MPFYRRLRLGADWQLALVFLIGPTFLNYFYLSSAVALVQEEVRLTSACCPARCCCW